ncbi:MAG: hypothetical protein RL885_33035 [Planctomycetota bacterium]
MNDCSASENTAYGFLLESSTARACSARGNQRGFRGEANTRIESCSTSGHLSNGVWLENAQLVDSTVYETQSNSAGVVVGSRSVVRGCQIEHSSTTRIYVGANGTDTCLIADNVVLGPSDVAIYFGSLTTNCTVIRNQIEGIIRNDGGVNNDVAPTESARTSVNPLANLSF